MNTPHTTRRGALLSAVLAAVAAITKPLAARQPAPPIPRRTWRKLEKGDFYRADDLGCAINPGLAATQMLQADCPIDSRHTIHAVSGWMVGHAFGILTSPDFSQFFWWRLTDERSAGEASRILWRKLGGNEPLALGDFYSGDDPNLIYEPKGGKRQTYGLLSAVTPENFGKPAGSIHLGKIGTVPGPQEGFWRPVMLT